MRIVSIIIGALTAIAAQAAPGAGDQRLTNAANVRLRAEPAGTATIVAALPFGAPLIVRRCEGAPAAWCEVETTDGASGWVSAPLTTEVDAAQPEAAADAIVAARLSRPRELRPASVDAAMEVLAFIERNASAVNLPESLGRWRWHGLRAMREVAAGIQTPRPWQPARQQWLRRYADQIVYNEIGGRWMVRPDTIARAHDLHRATAAADDIGWFLVENGLGGECEGDVPCYLGRYDRLTGQYLRWHPVGRHVDDAVRELADGISRILAMTHDHLWMRDTLDPATGCPELQSSLDALRNALAPTSSDAVPAALESLGRLAALCR